MAWYNESRRHSMSSRGIKSAQRVPKQWFINFGEVIISADTEEQAEKKAQELVDDGEIEVVSVEEDR